MNSYRESHTGKGRGERYDAHHAIRVDAMLWDSFVKPFVRSLMEQAASGGMNRYLDFACGTGRVLKVGHSVFGQSTGIDISQDMLLVAQKRVREARLIQTDVTREQTQEFGMFDCITLFRFILNAEDDLRRSVLKWISEHTESGGILILNNHRNSVSISSFFTRLAFWQPASARNRLSLAQTEDLLNEVGFSIERCKGFGILPTIFGRPIFGRVLQIKLETLLQRLGLGHFGRELVIMARKC